jgi:hypothetical protein
MNSIIKAALLSGKNIAQISGEHSLEEQSALKIQAGSYLEAISLLAD